MIGNDVVDLVLATTDSNWQRPGFMQKLFTLHEQQLIMTSANQEHMLWNLWTRKEAAYKILARETGVRRFMPLQLECVTVGQESAVRCKEHLFYVRTHAENEFIHSVAVTSKDDFERVIELPLSTTITKVSQLPFITDEKGAMQPVSISHHGRYHYIVGLKQFI